MFFSKFWQGVKNYFGILLKRLQEDRMTMMAGSLTYTTLLSLVPLFAVVFFLFSAFPMFEEIKAELKEFVFNNFVPTAGETIESYLETFIENSKKMTAIGVIGLVVTSLMVINAVESALNFIWRTTKKRSIFYKTATYWTILSLGPIFIGFGFVFSSYIFSTNFFQSSSPIFKEVLKLLPFIFSCFCFWALYCLVPRDKVSLIDCAIGAFFAAFLFELCKKLFAAYLNNFGTYELIYGVLATIPIFMLWIYLCWLIVLFGAEIAATLTDFNERKRLKVRERKRDLEKIIEQIHKYDDTLDDH